MINPPRIETPGVPLSSGNNFTIKRELSDRQYEDIGRKGDKNVNTLKHYYKVFPWADIPDHVVFTIEDSGWRHR